MTGSQIDVERRLEEFTEVHGTVLLGMHRELQSQLKKVDALAATAVEGARAHSAYAAKAEEMAKIHSEASAKTAERVLRESEVARRDFAQTHEKFRGSIQDSEAKLAGIFQVQKATLDAKVAEISGLIASANAVLLDINEKSIAHREREARFNRGVARVAIGILVFMALAAAGLVWKSWAT